MGDENILVMVTRETTRRGKFTETLVTLDLPGGKREITEGCYATALRECKEETGIDMEKLKGVTRAGGRVINGVAYWLWRSDVLTWKQVINST